ncbi:MAG: DUF4123 domain-containing protein [Planctomycetota bacterium]
MIGQSKNETQSSVVEIATMDGESFDEIIDGSDNVQLYAVLDSCNHPAVVGMSQINERSQSLYAGAAVEDYSAIAPYLFPVDRPWWTWFEDQLLDKPSGIFLQSTLEIDALRTHLRRLLKINAPKDQQLYFRFYDPRVLPQFLATAEDQLVADFFGRVKRFFYFDQEQQLFSLTRCGSVSPNLKWPVGRRLEVTEEHFVAMDQFSKDQFAKRLASYLKEVIEREQVQLSIDLDKRIQFGMTNSERYCLVKEKHVAKYVETMCLGWPTLETKTDPLPVQSLMLDRRLPIEERLEKLSQLPETINTTSP